MIPPIGRALILALPGILVLVAPAGADSLAPARACLAAAAQAERTYHIPRATLQGIAIVETGRRLTQRRERYPWPWTINVNGHGHYYKSKDEAVAAAERFIANGDTSLDIGCLQVNWRYHGQGFESLAAAFDPVTNATYAARFLKRLFRRNRNWQAAIAQYHSADTTRGLPYKRRVQQGILEARRIRHRGG